jgi:hypothetical protein
VDVDLRDRTTLTLSLIIISLFLYSQHGIRASEIIVHLIVMFWLVLDCMKIAKILAALSSLSRSILMVSQSHLGGFGGISVVSVVLVGIIFGFQLFVVGTISLATVFGSSR